MPSTDQCKNCEKTFDAAFDYCPYCGQETADNLTFGVLFSNTISNYFSIDARFFRSFVPLLTKPGVLARRFVDGKRLTYLHPAQFYLFISVIFFFVFSFSVRKADTAMSEALKKGFDREITIDTLSIEKDSIAIEQAKKVLRDNQKYTGMSEEELKTIDSVMEADEVPVNLSFTFKRKVLDSLIKSKAPKEEQLAAMGMAEDAGVFTRKMYGQILKFYKQKGGGILKTLYDTVPIAMFFMLPLFAFLLKIFYWKRATFAHHMVFGFYFFTFIFSSFCVLLLAKEFLEIPIWIQVLFYLSFILYLLLALRNFYKSSWLGAIIKANLISFIYMLFVVPVAVFGIMFVTILLY
ncbi:DUF3667 domain-containing protein [Ascidiimonas sp. W6]|uniref:DUF3667 domain-containing protein n=1 Tax=Ascidiimonas meishanensis TaxID=3128903 RepID=UPI0030EEE24E